MRLGYDRRRIAWFGTLLKQAKAFEAQERLTAPELARLRQQRLERLFAHARERSAFWRERIPAGAVALDRVPPLDKAEMMARYDDLVTDPSLRRDELLAWIDSRRRDEYYAGRYRVMTTSGSSGRKGLFVYDRAGWSGIGAQWLRASGWMGMTPGIPRRRLAMLRGASLTHMSTQGAASLDVGVHRVLGISVTPPRAGAERSHTHKCRPERDTAALHVSLPAAARNGCVACRRPSTRCTKAITRRSVSQ